ncbi:30S ribosomal protein S16 [Calidifontibacter sp. DB0510]|uniref:Small ribosomal subunit protein bS16 n=1 Tax=Metallococcus carri TaxID=1656884 RepID=A0A967AYZ2_9MICO|nr:30S ribosomal protein S16 [Metallococcus carri]NOP36766.1 30S ribosomal protein S16 [Calidifontibacter sp. DB2511S]
MAVKIRLKRLGAIRNAQYRVVVMDSRTKRDGRAIEEIGVYHPKEDPSLIQIDSERAQYWLGVGAQPTEQVAALLKVTGDWQKFKGEKGAEGTLKVAPPKPDKKSLYEAALKAAQDGADDSAKGGATTKKKAEKKADEAPAAEATEATEAAPAAEAADGGFGPDSAAPLADGASPDPAKFTVKGNKDSMKYHTTDSQWYDSTVAEVWFTTAEAAEAAGFVAPGAKSEG